MYDVIIVGGGPAGLSAALVLGRCRRRVLVCDDDRPRNGPARRTHGFFTRDGALPEELRRIGRAQLRPYDVEVRDVHVDDVERLDSGGFLVTLEGGETLSSRKLLLATGLEDVLPQIEGIEPLYGKSVHHCPYCDGWEVRDQPIACFGRGRGTIEMALGLTTWSSDVVLLLDAQHHAPSPHDRELLALHGVALYTKKVARLEGRGGRLERVVFADGTSIARSALFFHTPTRQRSELPARLGCEFDATGCVKKDEDEKTCVPGLFVAGDASVDKHNIAVAVAEGYKAAMAINKELRDARTSQGTEIGVTIV